MVAHPLSLSSFEEDLIETESGLDEDVLSNDYLNHYNEPLMLIEMAGQDPAFIDDLASWQPVSYLAYFQASPLRRASSAINAYLNLTYEQRCAFEAITDIMDRLILAAIASFRQDEGAQSASFTSDITIPTLRCLISEANEFINTKGTLTTESVEIEAAQDAIDKLMNRIN
jgi:hypothetical protein